LGQVYEFDQKYDELIGLYRQLLQWSLEGRLLKSPQHQGNQVIHLYRGIHEKGAQYQRSLRNEGHVFATEEFDYWIKR